MTTTTCPMMFAKGDFLSGVRWVTYPAGTRVRITDTSSHTTGYRVQVWGNPGAWAWVKAADVVTLTPLEN